MKLTTIQNPTYDRASSFSPLTAQNRGITLVTPTSLRLPPGECLPPASTERQLALQTRQPATRVVSERWSPYHPARAQQTLTTESRPQRSNSLPLRKGANLSSPGSNTSGDSAADLSVGSGSSTELPANSAAARVAYQPPVAFSHFDCQSAAADLSSLVRRLQEISEGEQQISGASAASEKDSIDGGCSRSNSLLRSCPHFRNEVGMEEVRQVYTSRSSVSRELRHILQPAGVRVEDERCHPVCNAITVLDSSPCDKGMFEAIPAHGPFVFEYIDFGAHYYRHFFYGKEHTNYFGQHAELGPLALSLRRERMLGEEGGKPKHQYRVIVRSADLATLRGTIAEEQLSSSGRFGSKAPPHRDVLEQVLPGLNANVFKVAQNVGKVHDQLLKLDEQTARYTYKVGVMYCAAGQSTEEEFYNNETGSPLFNEFLSSLGSWVELKGFQHFRGGLDTTTESTGHHSVFTNFSNYEIMFHVSTLLPFTPNNRQQLLRKRHIGNDIVTVVFQEPGSLPFTPKSVRSNFQHVFIIVRPRMERGEAVGYNVAVSRNKVVPPFGPLLPKDGFFYKTRDFVKFLLSKIINAENAVHRSAKLVAMAVRTRREYLKDLASHHSTPSSLDVSGKMGRFSFKGNFFREKQRPPTPLNFYSRGGMLWSCLLEDAGRSGQEPAECRLLISPDHIVLTEGSTCVFTVPTLSVLGWHTSQPRLRLYYNKGECLTLRLYSPDDIATLLQRLSSCSLGSQTSDIMLTSMSPGNFGIQLDAEGVVVRTSEQARLQGLDLGCRVVELFQVQSITLTHRQRQQLLAATKKLPLVFISSWPGGTARRNTAPSHLPTMYRLASYLRGNLPPPLTPDSGASVTAGTPSSAGRHGQLRPVNTQRTSSEDSLPANSPGLSRPPRSSPSLGSRPVDAVDTPHYALLRSPRITDDWQTLLAASQQIKSPVVAQNSSPHLPRLSIGHDMADNDEVARLRQENVSLRDEMTRLKLDYDRVTTQVRKFSSWFFNSLEDGMIDQRPAPIAPPNGTNEGQRTPSST